MFMKMTFRKTAHPRTSEGGQGYEATDVSDTLNVFDITEARTPIIIVEEEDDLSKSDWSIDGSFREL